MEKTLFMSDPSPERDGYIVTPYDGLSDFSDLNRFRKVNCPKRFGVTADTLFQLLPSIATTAKFNQTYILRFPEGVEGSLMKLHQGGMASTIIGANGKIAGTASLYEVTNTNALFNAFTALSFITGQYFLSDISSQLSLVNQKLDKILDFLETEKYTDLLSEISFIQHAVKNYSSIMLRQSQQISTLTNIQHSKIQAIANINFYLKQLKSVADSSDSIAVPTSIIQPRNCLSLACQLFAISTIMEVYYSQNFDPDYLESVQKEAKQILGIAHQKEHSYLISLATKIQDQKPKFGKVKLSKSQQQIIILANDLTETPEHPMISVIKEALSKPSSTTELFLLPNGDIYQAIS